MRMPPRDDVLAPLRVGEMLLHHTHTLLAFKPNNNEDRRIGLTASCVSTHVRPTMATRPSALLVRGGPLQSLQLRSTYAARK